MPRMILTWLALSVLIGLGITAWRGMTGQEQWRLTKIAAFATICSLVAVVLLGFLVIIF